MASRAVYPLFKAFDVNADLLIGGKLYTYDPGTLNDRLTYQDAAATTPHTNPIILDSLGEAEIFISGDTKFVLKDSADVQIWSKDNIVDGSDSLTYLSAITGSNTITATGPTSITAYSANVEYSFIAAGANTGAVTLNINGVGARAVTKYGSVALTGAEIPANAVVTVIDDGTRFQLMNVSVVGVDNAFTGSNAFSGSLTAPTLAAGDNSTQVATTAYADVAFADITGPTATVAANALTVGLRSQQLTFRAGTLTNGAVTTISAAPSNLVVPSGATLGTANGRKARLVLLCIKTGGAAEMAIINITGGVNLDETDLITTTAISTGADLNNVAYSITARTSVAFRVVGFIDITEATAGIWATAPALLQGAGGNALTAMSSLGYGQTWQDVSGSRVVGTDYYNFRGKPIAVNIVCIRTSVGANNIIVDGLIVGSAASTSNVSNISFIVPPGKSYKVGSSNTVSSWMELK